MQALLEGAAAIAAAAVVCAYAMWLWATQGAPAAIQLFHEVGEKIDELFSDEEPPIDIENCPLEGQGEGPPPELPPGGAPEPEPPIDITIPVIVGILAGATGINRKPVKPIGLSTSDSALWDSCYAIHQQYDQTKAEFADKTTRINELLDKFNNNRGTPDERIELCHLLDEQIELAKKLHQERSKYIDDGCDKFDWFNEGTTPADRKRRHEIARDELDAAIKNLYAAKNRFCK